MDSSQCVSLSGIKPIKMENKIQSLLCFKQRRKNSLSSVIDNEYACFYAYFYLWGNFGWKLIDYKFWSSGTNTNMQISSGIVLQKAIKGVIQTVEDYDLVIGQSHRSCLICTYVKVPRLHFICKKKVCNKTSKVSSKRNSLIMSEQKS